MEVTQEKIDEWKKIYGRVRKVSIAAVDYFYRAVTMDEYQNIQKVLEVDDNTSGEHQTVKIGLLAPPLPEKPGAGLLLTLSDEILKLSGFAPDGPPEEL